MGLRGREQARERDKESNPPRLCDVLCMMHLPIDSLALSRTPATSSLKSAELQTRDIGGGPNFKALAYKKAAQAVALHPVKIHSGREAQSVKFVGKDTARRIQSILGVYDIYLVPYVSRPKEPVCMDASMYACMYTVNCMGSGCWK